MLPEYIKLIRESVYHTQREFADLLSRLRGVPVSVRTVEGWEHGQRAKSTPIYKTDLAAIRRATKPRGLACDARHGARRCRRRAIVRKDYRDLCATCAAPRTPGGSPKPVQAA